jgi:hypothetical protein
MQPGIKATYLVDKIMQKEISQCEIFD